MIVVKVGGSLYDLPDLKSRLIAFIGSLPGRDVLLVPGGGMAADAVRAMDRDHGLGPTVAHRLALRACSLNAHFLAALLGAEVVEWPRGVGVPASDGRGGEDRLKPGLQPRAGEGVAILDLLAFVQRDEPGALAASWDVTSDSVAARAAAVAGGELVLLKSVTIPEGKSWAEASALDMVDPALPGLIERYGLRVRAVNLRASLALLECGDASPL
jgi:aspartokinase-like uncharacterized kinase